MFIINKKCKSSNTSNHKMCKTIETQSAYARTTPKKIVAQLELKLCFEINNYNKFGYINPLTMRASKKVFFY